MSTHTAAEQVCSELLPNLDPDILDYIIGILSDESADLLDADAKDETIETISGFLVSAEYCEDEEEAASKAAELIARLTSSTNSNKNNGEKKVGAPSSLTTEDTKLQGVISLADQLSMKSEEDDLVYGDTNNSSKRSTVNTIISEDTIDNTTNNNSKAKITASKKNKKPTASDVANAQINEIEAELHTARIEAVKSRWKNGAYRGAIDAQSFTLPNPGGGQPLLEDASCRLVYGKRYGLIGRNGMGKVRAFFFVAFFFISMYIINSTSSLFPSSQPCYVRSLPDVWVRYQRMLACIMYPRRLNLLTNNV